MLGLTKPKQAIIEPILATPARPGTLTLLRAERQQFLDQVAAIEAKASKAIPRLDFLAEIAGDEAKSYEERGAAVRERRDMLALIGTDTDKANSIRAKADTLLPNISDLEQRRAWLLSQVARETELITRKEGFANALEPLVEQIVAVEQQYSRALPKGAALVREAMARLTIIVSEVAQARANLATVEAELLRIGE